MFAALPDEMCMCVILHLSLHETETIRAVSHRFLKLATTPLPYQAMAARRWAQKDMTTARPLVEALLKKERDGSITWRDIFWAVESDGARARITEEELVRLRWVFSDGRQTCDFRIDSASGRRTLVMQLHGEMPWSINSNHTVQISRFPEHVVERLQSWGWVIKNQYIFMISINEGYEIADAASAPSGTHASDTTLGTVVANMSPDDINMAFLQAARQAGSAAAPVTSQPLTSSIHRIHSILRAVMFAQGSGGDEEVGDEEVGDEEVGDEEVGDEGRAVE